MNPRCFISYSWDSDSHKDWVRKLAEHLQSSGVDVYLINGMFTQEWTFQPIWKRQYVRRIMFSWYVHQHLLRRQILGMVVLDMKKQ